MSTLEFIVAIKWPATLLIMTTIGLSVLRWSAGTRHAVGTWMRGRNLRVHVAGQEIEATLAETQGSLDLAAGNNAAFVGTAALAETTPDEHKESHQPTPRAVELLRRAAVENVVSSAARLGWQWSQRGGAEPAVTVSWTEEGHPRVSFDPVLAAASMAGADATTLRATGINTEADARAAVRILLNAFNRQNDETVAQNRAMWKALDQRLRRNRTEDGGAGAAPGETRPG